MNAFMVEYTLRDKDGYAYELEKAGVCLATEKEAWDFYNTLPAYIEKHFSKYYILDSRSKPKEIGMVCHYNKEKLELS